MTSQLDIFGFNRPTKRSKAGRLIDARHAKSVVGERRYSPKEVANVLGCSVALVSQLCLRRRKTRDDKIDPRHFDDVRAERKYLSLIHI